MPTGQFKKILLVSATEVEMLPKETSAHTTLVTGVGMVATTFSLTKKLTETPFDLVINIGIAGTFHPNFSLGSVVQVVSDRFSELGVEDNGKFIAADKMGLVKKEELLFDTPIRIDKHPTAHGITVNRVHGSAETIQAVTHQFCPDVESMEGAAVAYVCHQFGIPWVQIRAISNKVEPRNRESWDIPLAIHNLHTEVSLYLDQITK